MNRRITRNAWVVLLLMVLVPSAVFAQITANLDRYTGPNAKGYLNPLKEGFGAALQAGMYRSAAIPRVGVKVNFDVKVGVVKFGDSDRTFVGTTEAGFLPQTPERVPTVVGSTHAVVVNGLGGAQFLFPGGLDLTSLMLPMPQITLSGFMGSQLMGRWISFDTKKSDVGKINMLGIGVRHSVSQYIPLCPVDIAAGVTWQKLKVGTKLLEANALSFGVQGSKKYSILEPYAGLSMDRFSMTVDYNYQSQGATVPFHVDFGSTTKMHLSGGLGINLGFFHLYGEVGTAGRTILSTGFSLGN